MVKDQKPLALAAIVLSRTLFLAMRIEDTVSQGEAWPSPISPTALTKSKPESIRLSNEDALAALHELIDWIFDQGESPDVICIGTYGAFVNPNSRLPRLGLEGIAGEANGPLAGKPIRAIVEERIEARFGSKAMPEILIETDTGVYAVGENYVRSLPGFGKNPTLTKDDPLAFGFFSGGVGAAVCQNLTLNRGLFVGQRGIMPVYPHPWDIDQEFEPKHPLHFSLSARTEIQSIEHRAKLLGYSKTSFAELVKDINLEVWDIVAHYIAYFCIGMLSQYSPRIIVLGGMVVNDTPHLIDLVREKFSDFLGDLDNHYTNRMDIAADPETYIQAATSLDTCLYGCLQIAKSHIQLGERKK